MQGSGISGIVNKGCASLEQTAQGVDTSGTQDFWQMDGWIMKMIVADDVEYEDL